MINYPILDFDGSSDEYIKPNMFLPSANLCERCVLTWFKDVIEKYASEGRAEKVFELRSELGKHPVYQLKDTMNGVLLVQPGVSGPLAAAFMEELIVLGCRIFIACGGAGALKDLPAGQLVLPSEAVRDEGTSYHYLKAGEPALPDDQLNLHLKTFLVTKGIDFVEGRTWTTDAIYRETIDKINLRKKQGCITVEMEAAAIFAVAKKRNVKAAQVLYAGDDLSGETWAHRNWQKLTSTREKLVALAVETLDSFHQIDQ